MTLSHDRLAKTLPTPFRYYERIGSTNDAALDWLENDAPDAAVVIANEQTTGTRSSRKTLVDTAGRGAGYVGDPAAASALAATDHHAGRAGGV